MNTQATETFKKNWALDQKCHEALAAWLKTQPKSVQARWGAALIDHEPEMMAMWGYTVVNQDIIDFLNKEYKDGAKTAFDKGMNAALATMARVEKKDVDPAGKADPKIKEYVQVPFMHSKGVAMAFEVAQATVPEGIKACKEKMDAFKASLLVERKQALCNTIKVPDAVQVGNDKEKEKIRDAWKADCFDV